MTTQAHLPSPIVDGGALLPDSAVNDFTTFALNALLLPLLDDSVPARWADPSLTVDCMEGRVSVDGGRPVVGAPVPMAFTVRWHLGGCMALGQALELHGDVELQVARDDHGYTARVRPAGLKLSSARGAQALNEPFTARLAMLAEPRP